MNRAHAGAVPRRLRDVGVAPCVGLVFDRVEPRGDVMDSSGSEAAVEWEASLPRLLELRVGLPSASTLMLLALCCQPGGNSS